METTSEVVPAAAAPVAVTKKSNVADWWNEMSTGNKVCCVFIGLFILCCWAMNAGPDPRDPSNAQYERRESREGSGEFAGWAKGVLGGGNNGTQEARR